jgi:O-antigen/teichoic acid export membrane protein
LAIPYVIGSIVLAKPILALLANEEVAENAHWVTPIVALGTFFYGLNILMSNVLFVRMKTYAVFKMNIFAAIFSLLLNAMLLYLFKSIIVAAVTNCLSFFLAFIYINKTIRMEKWPIDFQPIVMLKSVTASLFMAFMLFLVLTGLRETNGPEVLICELVLGVVVYAVGLLTLRAFSKKELFFLKGYICNHCCRKQA